MRHRRSTVQLVMCSKALCTPLQKACMTRTRADIFCGPNIYLTSRLLPLSTSALDSPSPPLPVPCCLSFLLPSGQCTSYSQPCLRTWFSAQTPIRPIQTSVVTHALNSASAGHPLRDALSEPCRYGIEVILHACSHNSQQAGLKPSKGAQAPRRLHTQHGLNSKHIPFFPDMPGIDQLEM